MIRSAKADFEKKLIKNYKKNPKPFYKYMISKQITKPIVRQLEQDDGTLTADESETANNLQNFFTSVFTGEDITNPHDIVKKQITAEMKDIFTRPDSCSTPKYVMLFNKSLCESRLPKIWKDAHITPIHKKGPKSKA